MPPVARTCRLDLLALQCKAWMGRVAAVIHAPFRDGVMVSGDARLRGRTLLDLNKVLSSFFDGLDPMSALPALFTISLSIATMPFKPTSGCMKILLLSFLYE